jgi:hypothetical protein
MSEATTAYGPSGQGGGPCGAAGLMFFFNRNGSADSGDLKRLEKIL